MSAKAVLAALKTHGLLPVQDKTLPNLVTIVTGDRPKGSWWSHPKGRAVFAALTALGDHRDVLFAKLIGGKVTLVHRRLWPDLLAAGAADAPWQKKALTAAARRLLSRIVASAVPLPCSGKQVKELEQRLLVHARESHSDSGKHVLVAESWAAWAKRSRIKPRPLDRALARLEKAAAGLGADASALPWT